MTECEHVHSNTIERQISHAFDKSIRIELRSGDEPRFHVTITLNDRGVSMATGGSRNYFTARRATVHQWIATLKAALKEMEELIEGGGS